ncbi:hypothetical protein FRC01_007006 [Tulasnella sp. 417]|nr:hypothetical protein FRC01_007006 [Tulasnella sp. 417]
MASLFLQAQPQPQASREYVFDDPFGPLRLPPLAQISEFWRRYDRLADIHDKRLASNLNGNLDVLLIFAALFSAVNTTFISITMPDLSPSPSDETNALLRLLVMRAENNSLTPSDLVPPFTPDFNSIIVNCLLYASLSCSLLAAVGAMMAKEWLQSFDRTGQTGPLEEQALFRQRKFNGVLEWHLEAVIKFLPNLLLLSVIFFFAGVCLFLFPINVAVAGIVIAFSGIGVVFSGIIIAAGAVSLTCPYQSAASKALRRSYLALARLWRLVWRTIIQPVVRKTSEGVRKFRSYIRPRIVSLMGRHTLVALRVKSWYPGLSSLDGSRGPQSISQDPAPLFGKLRWERLSRVGFVSTFRQGTTTALTKVSDDRVLTIQATRWLLETTSNRGDQISTAQFICSLDRTVCAAVLEDDNSWKRLLNLTFSSFEIWYSQPNKENQEVAELFGLVLCRVVLQCPKEDDRWKDITEESSLKRSNHFGKTFLQTLVAVCSKYSSHTSEDDQRILHISFIFTALEQNVDVKQFQWVNSCYLLDGQSPIAGALLDIWTPLLMKIGIIKNEKSYGFMLPSVLELLENRWTLKRVFERIRSVQGDTDSEYNVVMGYIVCLRRARELCQRDTSTVNGWNILFGLGELIWSYIDPLTTSAPTDIRLRLSVEVILTFKTFIPSHQSSSVTPVTSTGSRIPSATLIDAVAGLLLDDLTSLPNLGDKHEQRGRTFKACIIRIFLWIWKNNPDRNLGLEEPYKLLTSSCRLWAPLENEVNLSKTASFGNEEKPLTLDDLKEIVEFTEWVRSQLSLRAYYDNRAREWKHVEGFTFIIRNADVGINRLYAHFDRHADWQYHLYDLHEDSVSCSRWAYTEDVMI